MRLNVTLYVNYLSCFSQTNTRMLLGGFTVEVLINKFRLQTKAFGFSPDKEGQRIHFNEQRLYKAFQSSDKFQYSFVNTFIKE